MTADLSVTREIAASAEVVWALLADLPRMGEWSPENEGGRWLGDDTVARPGARFRGENRNGSKTWTTKVTIVDAEPRRRLSFRVTALVMPVADWSYDLEPTGAGCRVTESWTDRRPGFFRPIAARATGVADRVTANRKEMEATLAGLAAAAESAA